MKQWIEKNTLTLLFLGACPALAASKSVCTGLTMACAMVVTMLLTGVIISLLKSVMTSWISRLAISTLIALGVQMVIHAFCPAGYADLGTYFGVLSVSLMSAVIGEKAVKTSFGKTVGLAVCGGISLAVLIFVASALREIFGAATFAGLEIGFLKDYTIPFLQNSAAGAFVVVAIVAAIAQAIAKSEGIRAAQVIEEEFKEEA